MRRAEEKLWPRFEAHARERYGPHWLTDAWLAFTLGDALPIGADEDEFEPVFVSWAAYTWVPGDVYPEAAHGRPPIPVARHYLSEHGDRIDSFTARFIGEACAEPFSFFIVRDVRPGLGVTLRDLMLRRDFEVHERRGSRDLRPGAIVYARVVSLDGDSIILGCVPVVMPSTHAGTIIDLRDRWGIEAGDATAFASRDAASRAVCFGLLKRVLNPPPLEMNNADGDPLRFITLRYELQCSPQEASDALAPLTRGLAGDRPAKTDDAGRLVSVALPWIKEGAATPEAAPGKTLGEIEIDRRRLDAFVNSARRAEAFRREADERLGDQAVFLEEIEGFPDDLDDASDAEIEEIDEEMDRMVAEAARALWRRMTDESWAGWPDRPHPELDDRTPREAARTEDGRERVDAILLGIEGADGGLLQADTAMLRKALGLD